MKRDSPGPVFFSQERIGYMGEPFMIYKFRTMYTNAEEKARCSLPRTIPVSLPSDG